MIYHTPDFTWTCEEHQTAYQASPIAIVVGLALVLLVGAFLVCVWNGYSGVAFWFSIDNRTAKLYCTP